VCGPRCRCKRRRRLARRRRGLAVQDYRVDERARQRECRARRRAAAAATRVGQTGPTTTGPAACHAPASACNPADLITKVLEFWDRAVALSRASLERRMPVILRNLAASVGPTDAVTGSPSRAGLGADLGETT
jgi:hypothetical protein